MRKSVLALAGGIAAGVMLCSASDPASAQVRFSVGFGSPGYYGWGYPGWGYSGWGYPGWRYSGWGSSRWGYSGWGIGFSFGTPYHYGYPWGYRTRYVYGPSYSYGYPWTRTRVVYVQRAPVRRTFRVVASQPAKAAATVRTAKQKVGKKTREVAAKTRVVAQRKTR